MAWHATISKEKTEILLNKREEELKNNNTRTREVIQATRVENGRGKDHNADCNHIDDVEFTIMQSTRKCLRNINEAWERFKKGTYGICLGCQGQIPAGRLESIPETPFCVPCKNAHN